MELRNGYCFLTLSELHFMPPVSYRIIGERLRATRIGATERTPCIGELVTECTSQRSADTLSETLSETLTEPFSECHFLLRVAAPVAPNRVAPSSSCNLSNLVVLKRQLQCPKIGDRPKKALSKMPHPDQYLHFSDVPGANRERERERGEIERERARERERERERQRERERESER